MSPAAPALQPPAFSWAIFFIMALIFAASLATFSLLIRQWSDRGPGHRLREWAREQGFRPGAGRPPGVPADVPVVPPGPGEQWSNGRVTLVRLAAPPARSAAPPPAYHLLVRSIETPWPATGLRPAAAAAGRSFLDVYALAAYPVYTDGERFVAVGADTATAKRLAASPVRGLMPADVGLLLREHDFVLDFTGRPFDGLEFGRMIALAEQIMAHLPGGGRE